MSNRESSCTAAPRVEPRRLIQRLRRWWRPESAEEQYLAAATDLADLERRARVLERTSRGPAFVTFNH